MSANREIRSFVEGGGRGLIWGTSPVLSWRNWRKLQKSVVAIQRLRTGISRIRRTRLWRSIDQTASPWAKLNAVLVKGQGKVEVKLSLCTSWRAEVQLHSLLPSAVDGREWPASCPGRFTPGQKHLYHWIEGTVGPQSPNGRSGKTKPLSLIWIFHYVFSQ